MPRLTTKGQVTIPKAVREQLGVGPGDDVEFVATDGVVELRRRTARPRFSEYRGYLKHLVGRSTDDLIDELRGSQAICSIDTKVLMESFSASSLGRNKLAAIRVGRCLVDPVTAG